MQCILFGYEDKEQYRAGNCEREQGIETDEEDAARVSYNVPYFTQKLVHGIFLSLLPSRPVL